MATFTWNTGDGDFAIGSNWSPAGPPGTTDTALFDANSGIISGAGDVAALTLSAGGPWTWLGTVTAKNYTVNDVVTLSLVAAWTLSGTPSSSNYMVIGSGAAGSGNVTVTSGASIISTQTASTSAYALYVGSGSVTSAVGTLTVTGSSSSVSTGLNGAAVGLASTGTLTVQSGATANFATSDSSQIAALAVGRNAGSNGTVTVTGSGSSLAADGFVYIGRAGTGTLTVSDGATFTGGSAASGGTPAHGVNIGDANAATSSTLYFGGTGTATVSSAGTLHSLGNINLGLNGTTGFLTVDGSGSLARADLSIDVGTGTDRTGGKGTLLIQNGGTARAGTPANGISAVAIGIGSAGNVGTVTVTGVGSLLDANGYRISLGASSASNSSSTGGTGTLTISNGAHALSGANYTDTEAALAVGAAAGGTGTVTITGTGSELIASGAAVIGGNDLGSGVKAGGTGTVTVTSGGLLQTEAMTIERGSSLTVDSSGALVAPSITIDGGTANLATIDPSTSISFGSGGTLAVQSVAGANTIGNFTYGDVIDFVNNSSVTLSGTTLNAGGGSISIAAAPANASYQLFSDGNGGTEVSLTPQTIGVYRFFEQSNGTHFYTSSQSEANGLKTPGSSSYRSDLTPETNGFGAYTQVPGDSAEEQVFRFFDTKYGTEFMTASANEANGLMDPNSSTYRSDLTFESASSFYEDATQQPGDIAVHRFFDTTYGTHFYTGDQSEYAAITTPGSSGYRADLTYEGVGFYAPAGSYS